MTMDANKIVRAVMAAVVLIAGLALVAFSAFTFAHWMMHPGENYPPSWMLVVFLSLGAAPWLYYWRVQVKALLGLAKPYLPTVSIKRGGE